MIPVDQEFISDPSIGQYGDCQRAVIASLLSLPISEVPHFLKDAGGDADLFWQGMQSFLAQRGYTLLEASRHWNFFGADGIDVYHEISGPSPRGNGLFHAVVGCNGQVVFDPHPSRAGLAGDPNEWRHGYLVSLAQGVSAIAPPVSGPLNSPCGVRVDNIDEPWVADRLRHLKIAPPVAAGSVDIDDNEFRDLYERFNAIPGNGEDARRAWVAIVEHVNSWGAQQREAGRQEGRRDAHETNIVVLGDCLKAEARVKVLRAALDKASRNLDLDMDDDEFRALDLEIQKALAQSATT